MMNKYIPFTSRDERLDDTFYIVSDGDIIVSKKPSWRQIEQSPEKVFYTCITPQLRIFLLIVLMRQNYSYKYT